MYVGNAGKANLANQDKNPLRHQRVSKKRDLSG